MSTALEKPCNATAAPLVWVGCLACYNSGHLVGEWTAAADAADLTPEELHRHPTSHEELWCFDLTGFPNGTGEMSPSAAAPWGELFEQLGEHQWDALLAWVESGCYVADADDLPCVSDFEERYCGCWGSESDYAAHLAEELGVWDEIPEHLHSYFDIDAWWRDERYDYTICDAPDGGVYIFCAH